MQVEAIYSHGRIELIQPLRLKHDHIRVTVNVPDEEIDSQMLQCNLPAETISRGQAMLQQYEAILNAPLPPDADLPELSAEYQERLEAIDLRAQIRKEQGRPV
jgi:hypothetical protein